MAKGLLGTKAAAVVAVVVAILIAVGVGCAANYSSNNSDAQDNTQSSTENSNSEQNTSSVDDSSSQNSTGVIDPDDYESDADYANALIGGSGNEVDIPKEMVPLNEEGTYGYSPGWATVEFYSTYGEECAREIITEHGGIWVNSTFSWGSDTARVEVYFEDVQGFNELGELLDEFRSYEEVESAQRSVWFLNLA